jgi:hypothetical protein
MHSFVILILIVNLFFLAVVVQSEHRTLFQSTEQLPELEQHQATQWLSREHSPLDDYPQISLSSNAIKHTWQLLNDLNVCRRRQRSKRAGIHFAGETIREISERRRKANKSVRYVRNVQPRLKQRL